MYDISCDLGFDLHSFFKTHKYLLMAVSQK